MTHELPWRFDPDEMGRRRQALDALGAAAGADAVLLYGAQRSGPAVAWVTGWPVTAEAHVLLVPGEEAVLWVSYANHLPNARRLAVGAEVRPGGGEVPGEVGRQLARRGVRRLGVIGALPWRQVGALGAIDLIDLQPGFTRLRLVKSPAELDALRSAAAVTDDAFVAMLDGGVVGASEHQLQGRIQASYVTAGAGHLVSYLAVTSQERPDRCVPSQWPSTRTVGAGDVVTCELSASVAPDLAGQLLRTTVAGPPGGLVRELHAVAEACLAAVEALLFPGTTAEELVAASGLVEDAGYRTVDDVVHGYGGGYLPPVLSTRSRHPASTAPGFVLAAGMTLVVQPNVVTSDGSFGVQTGELLEVTPSGPRRFHTFPRGLVTA